MDLKVLTLRNKVEDMKCVPIYLNPNFEKGQLAIVLMANFTFKKACFNFD
jgi:hypothetical protein